jgi:two-component system cell cycle response regulator DivK
MVAEYLAFRGFADCEAGDGIEALELARRIQPEIVLMDLRMPGMDGWEATRRLKREPKTRHIPIVALTAHALTPEINTAREAGCDAVIGKPCDISVLADSLIKMLKSGPQVIDAACASKRTGSTRRTRR